MASIADLFGRLLLDDSGFEAAVLKSADKAGTKAGQSLSNNLSRNFKAAGLVAMSAVFAQTAVNVNKLDEQVKRFQADVGATDAEASAAAAATTKLYRSHIAGFDQILATLAKLRTDQGQTEAGAEALAGAYLNFANVAKTDGATAVKGLDDVLDAFNLTATDGLRVMDLLVVSNQKYGGSLQQRVADLAALAPALQGLNLNVEDAIALENLFASSGLDASDAQRALNTAVKNLQPGQTFDDLIRQVSSIQDPTERAQKAIEIFGVRGGTVLAQALRPGIDSLDDFKGGFDGAGGAAEAASKKIDSAFGRQLQLALQGPQATLVDLLGGLGQIGLAAIGITSAATALTSLGVSVGGLAAAASALAPFAALLGVILGVNLALEEAHRLDQQSVDDKTEATAAQRLYMKATEELAQQFAEGTISQDEYLRKDQELNDAYNAQLAKIGEVEAAQAAATAAAAAGATGATTLAAKVDDLSTVIETNEGRTNMAAIAYWGLQGSLAGAQFTADQLIADLITLNGMHVEASVDLKVGGVEATADASGVFARIIAERESDARNAAAELARAIRSELTDAFRASKSAADDFFDALHRHNLDAIEDARKTANAELEAQKKALFEGVDAAQAALDAKRQAERRKGLQRDVTKAALGIAAAGEDPQAIAEAVGRLRDARQALADFDAQAKIDADRAAAQATTDQLTAAQKANDDKAALEVEGENKSAAARQKAFDDGLAKLENQLLTEKGSHAKTLAAIAKLYVDAGIESKGSGAQIALGLAAGLLSEIKAVEGAAKTLAAAVAKYIRTGSPAEAGPFHDDPPDAMGRRLAGEFGKGLLGGFADLGPALKVIAGGLQVPGMHAVPGAATGSQVPSLSPALAGGPIAPTAATAVAPNATAVDGLAEMLRDMELHARFDLGGNQFTDAIARNLAWRRRST